MLHETAMQLAIQAGRNAPNAQDLAEAKTLLAKWQLLRQAAGLPLWE